MRFLIQRVTKADVTIDDSVVGKIQKGYLVLIGIGETDTRETADKMIKKMMRLRLFEDEAGKTNLSLSDVEGSLLLVSQFTLYADLKKGNRPSFIRAGNPAMSEELFSYIVETCKKELPNRVESGIFGADMKVSLLNDGPFTVWMDSDEL